jgi:hypothetical protein
MEIRGCCSIDCKRTPSREIPLDVRLSASNAGQDSRPERPSCFVIAVITYFPARCVRRKELIGDGRSINPRILMIYPKRMEGTIQGINFQV